jgi:hypothetical protein
LPPGPGVFDLPTVREATKPEADEPIIDLDKPLAPQLAEHRAAVKEVRQSLDPVARPRSWDAETQTLWAGLPREAQEQVLRRENDRDAEVRRQQNEAAQVRQEREQFEERAVAAVREWQTQGMAAAHTELKKQAVVDLWSAIVPELNSYGVKNATDWQALVQRDPARAEEYLNHWQRVAPIQQAVDQIQQHREAEYVQRQQEAVRLAEVQRGEAQQQFDTMLEAMDEQAHELIEGGVTTETQTRAERYFENIGGDMDELARMCEAQPAIEFIIHHPVFQKILDDAARGAEMLERARNARPKIVPKPLSSQSYPGSGGGPSLQRIADSGNMSAYIAARRAGQSR